ncbi:MAG: choice-of-anchor Q domain-containing protein [Segetibacter sp.]
MAEFSGGGIVNYNSTPTATNCIFSGNTAEIGGGIYNGDASVTLVNCSFSTNTAQNGGGIYNVTFFDSSSTALINCILWGNTGQIVNIEGSSTVVTYSIVQGGYAGTGNLDKDPLFVDAANGNLHLQSSSPAINAGLNSVNTTFVDLDGNNPRVVDDTIDMGAFEFQQQAMAVSLFYACQCRQ